MVLLRAKLKVRGNTTRGEGKYVRKMIGERHEDGRGWKIRGCLQIVIYKRRFPRTRPRNEAYARLLAIHLFIIIAADIDG